MANVQVSCSTGCIPTFNRAEAMQAIANGGFQLIEGYAFETESRLHPDVVFPEQVLEDLRKYKLKLSGLNVSDVAVGCNLTGIKREIEFASTLGLPYVNIKGGLRTERDMNALINSLKILVKLAKAHNIDINVRNCHGNRVENSDDFGRIFSKIDHPSLGIALDVGQLHSSKVDPNEVIDRFAPKIRVIYLRDQVGGRVVDFGKGEIDIASIVAKLNAVGFSGLIVAEPHIHKRDIEKDIASAHAFLQALLANGN